MGLPNVGKSTLFNTLSKCQIPAENFPFCTIEPNFARVNVPDERYNHLIETYQPKSKVPAFLEVHDIAGLVKGASEGAGLGNAFASVGGICLGGHVAVNHQRLAGAGYVFHNSIPINLPISGF